MDKLEEYICLFYGCRKKRTNEAGKQLFDKKYLNQGKVIDLSLLPPCQSALRLHILCASVIARIWNCADEQNLTEHGWLSDLTVKWIENNHAKYVVSNFHRLIFIFSPFYHGKNQSVQPILY